MNKIILVDFFDTLVHRAVSPESIKKIWANKISTYYGIPNNIHVYDLRFQIESELCHSNLHTHGELEFRYKDMITNLYFELKKYLHCDISMFLKISTQIELEIEKQSQYLNNKNIQWIIRQKKSGARIFLVSDFYFDKEQFKEILFFHNIHHLFEDLFISSDYMASKRSGAMFLKLKNELGLEDFKNVSMVGDNKFSDVRNAKKIGIKAIYSKAHKHQDYYKNFCNYNCLNVLSKFNQLYDTKSKLIYPEVVLAFYLFIKKLYEKLLERNVKDVLFLSREGEFLKQLFDEYVRYIGGKINSHYMFVSRRSTFLPSLKPLSEETFITLFRQYINISVKEFLLNLNFTKEQITNIYSFCDFDCEVKISDFSNSREFKFLKNLPKFIDYYEINRAEQNKYFKCYFEKSGISHDSIHIVDIGWKGTIQDNLTNLLDAKQINGYYFGLSSLADLNKTNSNKIGIVFDETNRLDYTRGCSIYKECTSIYEVLLGASHGTVERYLPDGLVKFVYNKDEEILFNTKIKSMQNSMLDYFIKLVMIFDLHPSTDIEIFRCIDYKYFQFIFSPSKQQMEYFKDLYHVESFGVHELQTFRNADKFIVALFKLLSDHRVYIQSAIWPSYKLFNDKLGFLIPIYKLYKLNKQKQRMMIS